MFEHAVAILQYLLAGGEVRLGGEIYALRQGVVCIVRDKSKEGILRAPAYIPVPQVSLQAFLLWGDKLDTEMLQEIHDDVGF